MGATFQESIAVAELFIKLKDSGVIGLLEFRNYLQLLFPNFSTVRDEELDEVIKNYVQMLGAEPDPFSQEKTVFPGEEG